MPTKKNSQNQTTAKKQPNKPRSQDDSVWKEAIDDFLQDCIIFFFFYIHKDIDWTRKHETLDNELAEITQDSEAGSRRVDKLIKVFLKSGLEKWLLIHIEVQGYKDTTFAERMYLYNQMIYLKYKRDVESLAILTDNNTDAAPTSFTRGSWKTKDHFEFDAIKLATFKTWEELENDPNPFALVVLAHLKTQALKGRPIELKEAKIQLARLLFQRGYSREDVIKLYRFIDWIMRLPKSFQEAFKAEVRKYSQEVNMPILTDIEIDALKKGRREGKQEGLLEGKQVGLLEGMRVLLFKMLNQRFGMLQPKVVNQINNLTVSQLEALSEALLNFKTKSDLTNWLKSNTSA